jgi:glycosyltransferase involved in cell wall biosynthesis
MPEFYQNVKLEGADVVLLDSHSFAHHVPRHPHAIYLCYYHTSARALWNPEIDNRANTGRMALLRKWIAPKLKALDLAASRNPEYLIANSQTTAERVLANYGRQVDEVIYPPVDVTKWLDTRRIDTSQGFLMWGRLIDYKRVDLAIEAAKQTGYQLNIVGKGPLEAHLRALAKGSDNIIFWGRLDDDRLKELMAHCLAVLFPGYEDFGIVPVEAMAAGLPVIAYRKGGAAESVNGFGLLLEAQDANELAAKMTEIQTMWFDPQRLKENAKRFDVEIFRAKYRAAVRRAVDRFGYKIKKEL